MDNIEKSFRMMVLTSAGQLGYHVIDIPDDAKAMLKFAPELAGMVEEKIYDCGLLHNGRFCGLELKHVNDSFTFARSKVAKHQEDALVEARACGGLAYVLVNFRMSVWGKNIAKYKASGFLLNRVFAIPIEILLSGNSWTILELEKVAIECHIKNNLVDLSPLWKTTN